MKILNIALLIVFILGFSSPALSSDLKNQGNQNELKSLDEDAKHFRESVKKMRALYKIMKKKSQYLDIDLLDFINKGPIGDHNQDVMNALADPIIDTWVDSGQENEIIFISLDPPTDTSAEAPKDDDENKEEDDESEEEAEAEEESE
jgi:hypothetical protein